MLARQSGRIAPEVSTNTCHGKAREKAGEVLTSSDIQNFSCDAAVKESHESCQQTTVSKTKVAVQKWKDHTGDVSKSWFPEPYLQSRAERTTWEVSTNHGFQAHGCSACMRGSCERCQRIMTSLTIPAMQNCDDCMRDVHKSWLTKPYLRCKSERVAREVSTDHGFQNHLQKWDNHTKGMNEPWIAESYLQCRRERIAREESRNHGLQTHTLTANVRGSHERCQQIVFPDPYSQHTNEGIAPVMSTNHRF